MKNLGILVMLLAMAGALSADRVEVPEIDGSSAGTAVALVTGGLMVLRGRKK